MDFFRYIVRFLYRIRWYLLILPLIALAIAWYMTRSMEKQYNVETTIYTGIISGYNLETGVSVASTGNSATNMANLMNIITTQSTIKRVGLRLFARSMMYGDPEKNNNYITAQHFAQLNNSVPQEVKNLIDKKDEARTVANLLAYERPAENNYIYRILNFGHPWFSFQGIAGKLKVVRLGNSDMIQITYNANDPGIAYNTLDILNDEFIDQYQQIRFGETNNVIKFFEGETARLYRLLVNAEDSLIAYNVAKRIINYGEQTKMVANMDRDFQTDDNSLLMNKAVADATVNYLEDQLGEKKKIITSNDEFITQLNIVSKLKSRVSNLELMNEDGNEETQAKLDAAKKELADAEAKIKEITLDISKAMSGTNGVKMQEIVEKWLTARLVQEEVDARNANMDVMRQRLDKQFLYFSPIGATIGRKERHIGFIENNYMAMLNALNAARLRQKNLQMSTATLKVLNPPLFPLSSLPTNRMMILLATYFITLILTAAYFFLLELLDQTLRDRMRTERLTKGKVIGAYPAEQGIRYRRFNKVINDMALRQISKTLLPFMKEGQPNIINLISTEEGDGKSMVATLLEEYWSSMGLNVRKVTYDEDFLAEDSKFVLAQSIKEVYPDINDNDIILVEYPELSNSAVNPALLNEATLNLMLARATRTWKDTDNKAYKELMSKMTPETKKNFFIYLTQAGRPAVEEFVGQLPPYTMISNYFYRISQMGLTAKENAHNK
ncbi:MAG: hypothetical protein MJZ73_02920 [Bacteroidaceae bacterium]|nr:hypothetical protein [Bacteroidaceae bacterium]